MRRAGVAFDGGNVVGELGGIFGGVGPGPGTPCFFIHPCDDAKGTRGTEVKALEKFTSLHGNDDAGSVVDRARAEIPGIEMSGHYDDLFRMLGAFEVRDDVIAGFVGQLLRSKSQMHADLAFGGEVDDEVGVFGGNRTGGDSGRKAEAGVREAIVGVADGANHSGDGAEVGCGFGSGSSAADSVPRGGEGEAGGGFLLVENCIEEHDLAGNFIAAERGEFFKSADCDDLGGDAIRRCRGASAESGQDNLLRCPRNHAGILNQGCGFGTANPVRHGDWLKSDVEAELTKFVGNILRGPTGLNGSAGTGSDILGKVCELPVGVIVVQGRGFDRRELLEEQWREVLLLGLSGLLRGHKGARRLGRLLLCLGGSERSERQKEDRCEKCAETSGHTSGSVSEGGRFSKVSGIYAYLYPRWPTQLPTKKVAPFLGPHSKRSGFGRCQERRRKLPLRIAKRNFGKF